MKHIPVLLSALLALGATAVAIPSTASLSFQEEADVVGQDAAEIETRTWFNHIGQNPSMEAYRGKVVVIEMWATW
ncbi:MAG: hypothetical protein P1V35_12985 [Planctomycetota bacterium]|nr:hypothetical protein [Planctomycetota bacterium]